MAVDHLQELHGLPTFDFFLPEKPYGELPEPDSVAWRISVNPYEGDGFDSAFDQFLEEVDASRVRALIIGQWGDSCLDDDSSCVVELITANKGRLASLKALFIGDLVEEEAEISWIRHADVTPLLNAFPDLLELGVRGGTGLEFPAVKHEKLRTLSFETGGLPSDVVRGVAASELPALKYLELWLGVEEYGGDATVGDLAPILSGGRFPALRHLGLQNSEIQDEVATAVAAAPVVAQLNSLDLSLGVLTDTGAEALLSGQPLTHLTWLDLHHNYCSEGMGKRILDLLEPSGVEVDMSKSGLEYEGEYEDTEGELITHRYTAVSE